MFKKSKTTITRGATAPFILSVGVDPSLDLSSWKVTFTLRTNVLQSGEPLFSFDNTDSRMTVSGTTVTVTLGPEDIYTIPELCRCVFIQLLLEKDGIVDATWVYSVEVTPNLKPEETE